MATAVVRSRDGITFEPVCEVYRGAFGAESFERPVVLRRPDGGWRLYLSCATPGSKHWWIEALDADRPEDLPTGHRTVVLPGSAEVAVKDPVITVRDGEWEMWLCEHPLDEPGTRTGCPRRTSPAATACRGHVTGPSWGLDPATGTPGACG